MIEIVPRLTPSSLECEPEILFVAGIIDASFVFVIFLGLTWGMRQHERTRNWYLLNTLCAIILLDVTTLVREKLGSMGFGSPSLHKALRLCVIGSLLARAWSMAALAIHWAIRVYQWRPRLFRIWLLGAPWVLSGAAVAFCVQIQNEDGRWLWVPVIALITSWGVFLIACAVAWRRFASVYPAMLRADVDTADLCRRDCTLCLLYAVFNVWGSVVPIVFALDHEAAPSSVLLLVGEVFVLSQAVIIATFFLIFMYRQQWLAWLRGLYGAWSEGHPWTNSATSRLRSSSAVIRQHRVVTSSDDDDDEEDGRRTQYKASAMLNEQRLRDQGVDDRQRLLVKWNNSVGGIQ